MVCILVFKGGCWKNTGQSAGSGSEDCGWLLVASRDNIFSGFRVSGLGFRV